MFSLFTTQFGLLTTLRKKPFENIVRKGENVSTFSTLWKIETIILVTFNLSFAKINAFNLDKANIFLLGKELTHYQTTNFRLFQTERVCRWQFQIRQKWKKVIQTGRKHEQFLLFLQCFQKVCFPRASKGVIVWEWVNEQEGEGLW